VHCQIRPPSCAAQAQQKYLEAVQEFGRLKDNVDELLAQRDEAYLELLAVPDSAGDSLQVSSAVRYSNVHA
jgi:hypothetical protein